MSTPIMIGGKRIGKFKASFLLFKESWRFLSADKEMVALPVIMLVCNLVLSGFVVGVAALSLANSTDPLFTGDALSGVDYLVLFMLYVVGAFTLALSQAAITHTVYTRMHNGNATIGESLKVAFSHAYSLLLWSAITATVGIILRMVSDRSALLGKMVSALMGAAWAVATFFVIPAIVIGKKSAVDSIPHSINVFKKTWGETLVNNIALGLVFLVAHILAIISFIGLIVIGVSAEAIPLIVLAFVLFFAWLVVASLVNAALQGVIKTVLYVYALEATTPVNFNRELLDAMLAKAPQHDSNPAVAIETPRSTVDSSQTV